MKRHKDMKKGTSGFAVLETILILVVIAIIGFTGWYVWQSKQSTDKTTSETNGLTTDHSTGTAASTSGLKLSSSKTFYDCVDAYNDDVDAFGKAQHPDQHSRDSKTGSCTMNGTVYALPKEFTDDNIRDASSMHFTASEVAYLRAVGKKNFKACSSSPGLYGTIFMMGESSGKYLYYGVGCDGGYQALAVLVGSGWKVVYEGQDIIACETITKYDIPHSLFGTEGAQCFSGANGSGDSMNISDL